MITGGINWGTVPDWLAAVGTVGALLLTYLLLRHELIAWRAERREQERHREEARRAQAGAVASWIEEEDAGKDGPIWTAYVSNASPFPVFSCEIEVSEPLEGTTYGELFAVVPPGGERTWRLDRAVFSDNATTIHALNSQVRFTDAQGNHWRRNWYGDLEPMHEKVRSC